MFKMVKKIQNSGLEIVGGLTRPLRVVCRGVLKYFFGRLLRFARFSQVVSPELRVFLLETGVLGTNLG